MTNHMKPNRGVAIWMMVLTPVGYALIAVLHIMKVIQTALAPNRPEPAPRPRDVDKEVYL